ncbi:MAG: threonine ammonia-lyase, biosynthetic [Pseudomonadota bacterium]
MLFKPRQALALEPWVRSILTAAIYDLAQETPVTNAPNLSRRMARPVVFKREDLQPIFSFKIRGAYNRMLQLSPEQRLAGVIAASAGNHAQGVAIAAHHLNISSVVIMPKTTPTIKVDAVRRWGSQVELIGDTFDQAAEYALNLSNEKKLEFIHPYDDAHVIAGQGTVGMEIIRQCAQPPAAIFLPVGGGGLLAGVAAYVKYVRPDVKIIGVEPEEAASLQEALIADERIILKKLGIFVDGAAVRQIGKLPFEIARHWVDEVITVSNDEICAAIKDIFEDTRCIAEPAGALSVAGLKKYVKNNPQSTEEIHSTTQAPLLAVVSGANMNFDRLRYISERTELGEGREAIVAVSIPEKPGSFRAFCRALGKRNITEFNYRYSDEKEAHVYVGIQMSKRIIDLPEILKTLAIDYAVVDLTDNEIAKLHIRHLVGGRAAQLTNERVFRFEFPERPGALMDFLEALGEQWSITLFHYRNHGAAYGRVFVGFSIPNSEQKDVNQHFDKLGFEYWEETSNPAYQLFVR